MARIAFIFPGQGSQSVGMGRELVEHSPVARELFARADATLGRALSTICFEGPEEELTRSANTQPALLVVSAILTRLLADAGATFHGAAGHSLGEYSALHAVGTFAFETAVGLVAQRGAAMSAAAEARPGAMAALLGVDFEAAEKICAEATQEHSVAVVANDNCPGQLVLSGDRDALMRAADIAKTYKARRIMPLPVQGAFHSPLMKPAAEAMADALAAAPFAAPDRTFLANVTAAPIDKPEAIRAALIQQITGGVRWRETIEHMVAQGFDTFVEVGWGTVLTGMMKRLAPAARAFSVQSVADVAKVAPELR